jgi:biotin carboxyl carrier protein
MKTTLYAAGETLVLEYTQSGDTWDFTLNEQLEQAEPLSHTGQVRLLSARDGTLTLLVDGRPVQAHIAQDGARTLVSIEGQVYEFARSQEKKGRKRKGESGSWDPEIVSPMPGKILEVQVAEGDEVEADQTLILLEAMKMENALASEGKATVKKIHVAAGDLVELGQVLIELEPIQSNED